MSLQFIIGFSLTVFIASIIPGPSMLLALTHGMHYGVRRTMASALGNVAVTLVQALVSIVGLGTVLLASETIFLTVKWAGAAYLIYMGVSMLLASGQGISAAGSGRSAGGRAPLRKLFFQAAVVTAGNPKAIVFFTAVFPQFINPDIGYFAQSSMLLALMMAIAFTCFMLYAALGTRILSLFSTAVIGERINKTIGVSFIGAGIGLAISHR